MTETVYPNRVSATVQTSQLARVLDKWAVCPPVVKLVQMLAASPSSRATVAGLSGSSEAFLVKSLAESLATPLVAVTETSEQAGDLYDDLTILMGQAAVGHFPARQILPYDFRAPVGEIMGRRISTLASLLDNSLSVVICPIRALLEPTMPLENLRDGRISLRTGSEADLNDLARRLVLLGFRRVSVVEEVGDFAQRGGLIDFFSPGSTAPVRVEFFGDEIDTIREFDVSTQRTLRRAESVSVLPRREVPITQQTLENYLSALPDTEADFIRSRYLNDPELPGLEWLSILFGMRQGFFFDYFPAEGVVYLQGEGALRGAIDQIMQEGETLYRRLCPKFSRLPRPEEYYHATDKVFSELNRRRLIDNVHFRSSPSNVIDFGCHPHPAFASRLDLLVEATSEYAATGIEYFIATDTAGQAARLDELIGERVGIENKPVIEVADLKGGFVCPTGGLAVLTDHEIFGRYHRRVRRKRFQEGVAISDYSSLTKGDYVVHIAYGIARYLGLQTLTVDSRSRDCLLLQYADNGKLYVPIEEFNQVSKYSGKDSAPQLTGLGGAGWEKLKNKTKKAIADMAADLIKLYAHRKTAAGIAFGEDTVWLKQLEASFQYEETPDQIKAIGDVKRDMADEKPMDRLICGDVGYGKTEVAVRAAFKANENNKQVAVLVPTTVLAQQHLHTFTERFREFPFRIEMLSRFRTRQQQQEIVKGLAEGKVDLVIGTHRLLSEDVHFKDLGLLVVDEEHRFGVKHKEKLRQLMATVDTLSMSATPIPRTLQMSLIAVRDMSLIHTSPKDRLPIITEIAEFDPAIIAAAILREIDRGGQVFFVHNRVQSIESMHRFLSKLVPQAKIAVAHGQMHERSLEGIMLAFLARRYNVLLCTAIIESGLDIPTANTIIINRADRFGLAELYQLRGRVGRSATRAYAYLLTPPMRGLTEDAVKRLRALEAHSDLGSGFALAMRDLEIRGAGTILGARQSGFIEEIGFDLYNRLLEEAVAELKGQEITRLPETKVDVDMELHLSDAYVPDRQQKVDIYRRLANARTLDEVEAIRDEVSDRFGKPPQSATNLFDASAVKISASALEIEKVRMRSGIVTMTFKEGRTLARTEVESLRRATDRSMEFSLGGRSQVTIDLGQVRENQWLLYLRGVLGRV
ncbi:MAG TPA: transcription-repair coupling factor [Candidatus Deferrimicrobium sp.]|nr:transcription-repair coupling factor [Candidatus Deferrimicrobium sp.]